MNLDDFLRTVGLDVSTTAGGVVGGLLSLAFVEKTGLAGKISAVIGGWACAHFLTPHIKTYFEVSGSAGGIAFLLGLFGMLVVAAIANTIKNLDLVALVTGWIKKITGQQ